MNENSNIFNDGTLTDEELAYFMVIKSALTDFRDNYPDDLAYALGDTVTNIDVAGESSNNITGYFLQNIFSSATTDDGTIDFELAQQNTDNFIDAIPTEALVSAHTKLQNLAVSAVTQYQDPSFSGTPSGRFSPSKDIFSNAQGQSRGLCFDYDCGSEWASPLDDCYENCDDNGYWEIYDDEDSDGPSALANTINAGLDILGNAVQEIGADNIFGWLVGNDGDSGDTTNYYINEDGERVEGEKPFNWGLLAIGALVTIVVIGGIIYLVRKKD